MREHRLEVADVFRSCQDDYFRAFPTSGQQRRVFRAICACRTAALGGHLKRCDQCGYEEISYNSCRDRHCPKCQGGARAQWLEARAQELLPVPYFHVVFTLPKALAPLALQNPRTFYSILFRAASQTLLTLAADERHLGARIGFLALLHTWGQKLDLHPHLHCLVPGGGLSQDQSQWIPSRPRFLLPVDVLSCLFRHKFLHSLRAAYRQDQLSFHGTLQPLKLPRPFDSWLQSLTHTNWVVYCKPPFAGPERVLKYLARYTHRVAISNSRLLSLDQGKVRFRYKDYRQPHRPRTLTLDTPEFTRRFLLHVLPKGFMRIRHYGILANRHRRTKLTCCRGLLAPDDSSTQLLPSELSSTFDQSESCPRCPKGTLSRVQTLPSTATPIQPRMNSPGLP